MVKTEQITIRISKELKEKIIKQAESEYVPAAQWIRNLIIKELEKCGGK